MNDMSQRPAARSASRPSHSDAGLAELRAVREAVFVQEQGVPLELEWDALDPLCVHVLARDDRRPRPIGTGRLTPEHKIGRMAVLPRMARPRRRRRDAAAR